MNYGQDKSSEDILSTLTLCCTRSEKFLSGSSYEGEWDSCQRMHGSGIYRFPDGTEYHGHFKHGLFHGDGLMLFPDKYKVRARWDNGKMGNYEILFPDGLIFIENNWTYCTKGDRRYAACIRNGIPPVGGGYVTKDIIERKIPPGCYDAEEGFYNPKKGLLYPIDNLNVPIRVPSIEEGRWIVRQCRKAEPEPVGRTGAYQIIKDMQEQLDDKSESFQYTDISDYTSYTNLLSEDKESMSNISMMMTNIDDSH